MRVSDGCDCVGNDVIIRGPVGGNHGINANDPSVVRACVVQLCSEP